MTFSMANLSVLLLFLLHVAAMKTVRGETTESSAQECVVNDEGECINEDAARAPLWNEEGRLFDPINDPYAKAVTCDSFLDQEDYEFKDEVQSSYDFISFSENPKMDDKCMYLGEAQELQICTSYRPHYHEHFVHFPAAYMDTVKRVVIVGAGDNMALNEVLKYPTVEFVIQLEIDQRVPRKCFQHFKIQPHFDDERVHWWFGDAAKSINLLPKEYFGSFDLVLVDLSETVLSFDVTDYVDIVGALALLLKPDGVFVKNDVGYFDKMSELFDYSAQINLRNVPIHCHQEHIIGSNRIDFLSTPNFELMKKGEVETLVYKPLDDLKSHYQLIDGYSKNDARLQGKCDKVEETRDDSDDERDRAGVLLVVEAENATGPLQSVKQVEEALFSALKDEGLTPLSAVTHPSEQAGVASVIAMREGFVAAHTWPEHDYCALDIHLWGGFGRQERVRSALLEAIGGSKRSSTSYRVVVGGMYGTNTWSDDKKAIGPRIVNSRNCDGSPLEDKPMDQSTVAIVVEESLKLLGDNPVDAAVLCGDRSRQPCWSLEALAKDKNVKSVIALWSCPADGSEPPNVGDTKNGVTHILLCGGDVVSALKSAADDHQISSFIVDASAPTAAIKEAHKLCTSRKNEEILFKEQVLFVVVDPSETSRALLITACADGLDKDTVIRTEISLDDKDRMKFGLLLSDDPDFLLSVIGMTSAIEKRTGLGTEVQNFHETSAFQAHYDPHSFAQEAYDMRPGLSQYSSQKPLAYQSIFQFGIEEGEASVSAVELKWALDHALYQSELAASGLELFRDIGDGALVAAIFSEGHAILVWDGNMHVDLNLLTYGDVMEDHKEQFVEHLKENLPNLKLSIHDEQPRGFGRVVTFEDEIDAVTAECWDLFTSCKELGEKGKCETDTKWMGQFCNMTCGLCQDSQL